MKVYKDHRDIGLQVGQGTATINGEECQIVVMQIGVGVYAEHRIVPLGRLMPVPPDALEFEAISRLLQVIETVRALGMEDWQIEQAFSKAMEPRHEVGSGGTDTARDEEQPGAMRDVALLKVT
jgi:hypothetical protein